MIRMNLGKDSYNIEIERGNLAKAGELLDLNRKVMIITDEGVPMQYAKQLATQCKEAYIKVVLQGEGSKSLRVAEEILTEMLTYRFSRKDCVVAVGGGVVGDLAGVVASLYMRGIDFYNVPTTVLSQVDSSIGGKTAVNLAGIKNIIGAFHQPKAVLIDPDTLKTLPERQIVNGLMEAVKVGATSDAELFAIFEKGDWKDEMDVIIEKALLVKKYVVEQDEKESHLRKILNFGHTIGHGFESVAKGSFLHGECVAIGMLYMSSKEVRERLFAIYEKLGFAVPELSEFSKQELAEAIAHDKKADGKGCSVVWVSEIGDGQIQEWQMQQVTDRLECE
ncbi:MAG: 3-dehydroquinate synthase [Faecalimonas sp.]|nr:3-dehydroquinate synthase [Faecalimonas sp.]